MTITGTDCSNGNLEDKDEFKVQLQIKVNYNKETNAQCNCQYVQQICLTHFAMITLISSIMLMTLLTN